MTQTILYVATSLDGYIAKKDGDLSWLSTDSEEDYGYQAFFDSIDALAIGNNTYQDILSFGEWPYEGKHSYIFTSEPQTTDRDDISFVSNMADFRKATKDYERIWLVGGGELAQTFFKDWAVDEVIISIIPIILGDGIPLFLNMPDMKLDLVSSTAFESGLVQVHYKKKAIKL